MTLRVALGEYDTGWHDPQLSLKRAGIVAHNAAHDGAKLLVLPEMATTGFTMDAEHFAESLAGESSMVLGELAAKHAMWIVAGMSVREAGEERASNVAVAFGPDGAIAGSYRKQRLFGFAEETKTYAAGSAPLTVSIEGVRTSLFVCYDLRFPELFREVARASDLMLVIANWPVDRRAHWDALLPARAIENQCYVIGVNRLGVAGGLTYDGGSAAYGPWGERFPGHVVDVDPSHVAAVRERYPFLPQAAE
ncbi:MAG: Aliphatic amidase AmiE [Gemmatimonadetes bacterium]|nr:Aliphatic amidase AmiE [Gemmatimonadota bacterium]